MPSGETKFVIITGMSGAGKTVAIQSFEDLGYFCVDNLPPTLIPKFLELLKDTKNSMQKVALVIDLRGRDFFDELHASIDEIAKEDWIEEHILFLDATNDTLVRRYKETRRSHPLNIGGLPLEGIKNERKIIDPLRGRAQRIIDTSTLKPKELREKIHQLYAGEKESVFSIHFVSFGFKHGVPIDADIMFDVRFLPNPFYVEQMRPLTGQDKEVSDYVFKWSETKTFNQKLIELLHFTIPFYKKEGKSQIVIAIGCTGGQHRSVALTEYYKEVFAPSYVTHITHRDIEKRKAH